MTLKEHLLEAVASRRTNKYGPEPTKVSIVDWCRKNGFLEVEWTPGLMNDSFPCENSYMLGPNFDSNPQSNWLRVHSNSIQNITFWFNKKGNLKEIILFDNNNPNMQRNLYMDEATKILIGMLE